MPDIIATAEPTFTAVMKIPDERLHWFNNCAITVRTIAAAADSFQTKSRVLDVLQNLSDDPAHTFLKSWYRFGMDNFGEYWRYLDARAVLNTYSYLAKPRNYLEIGIRNGMSLCMVASACPSVDIVAFDLFQEDYGKMPLHGPDHIRSEIEKFNHSGSLTLIAGDSHATVPEFLKQHSEDTFDLIFVDGDHSAEGAKNDLETVVSSLSYGGMIVFDDICNPNCHGLYDVWKEFSSSHDELDCISFMDGGNGVAFGLKTATHPN